MADWRFYKDEAYRLFGKEIADQIKALENMTWKKVSEYLKSSEKICEEITNEIIDEIVEEMINELLEDLIKDRIDKRCFIYKYKIDQEFISNTHLLNILKRYQIYANYDDDSLFENNSVIHALKQTNLFDDETLNEMKLICSDPHPSTDNLNELGKQFNILFRIVKFNPSNNTWDDITRGRRNIGDSNGKLIELALIEGHYILNETVEGISSYSLKNYKEIEEVLKDKNYAYKLTVVKQVNGRFKIDTKQAHIKSYELIRLITRNKIEN